MKDGNKIDIDEMSISHLRNTLKMLVRNSQKRKKVVEFKLNGDVAQDFNSSWEDYDDWMDAIDQASL